MVPAHLPAPGLEGFYVGLVHPFAAAEQFLAVAAAGFLYGQQPRAVAARAWWAFPAATVGGMLAGLVLGRPEAAGPILYALATFGGGLIALAPRLPAAGLAALGLLVGAAAGLAAAPDPGNVEDTAVTAAGALAGVNAIALYGFGAASWAREQARLPWLGIGVRVVGSWIVAIAVLMLALALRR